MGVPPTRGKRHQADQLELDLSELDLGALSLSHPVSTARSGRDEAESASLGAVECPVRCQGTESCLCGQGELSDNPLWIEND